MHTLCTACPDCSTLTVACLAVKLAVACLLEAVNHSLCMLSTHDQLSMSLTGVERHAAAAADHVRRQPCIALCALCCAVAALWASTYDTLPVSLCASLHIVTENEQQPAISFHDKLPNTEQNAMEPAVDIHSLEPLFLLHSTACVVQAAKHIMYAKPIEGDTDTYMSPI